MQELKRLKRERFEHVDRGPRVVSLDGVSALRFFGFNSATHEAIDVGPPADPHKWKPGARVFECRLKRGAMN